MITEAKVLELVNNLESFNVEKTISTKDTSKFCQAICAFSNDYPSSGLPGYLLLGVSDDGKFSGLRITDELNKEISGLRTDGKILPIPNMSVGNFRFPEGDVLVVEILPSLDPPVRYEGRTWIRNGARKAIATFEEEQRLIERKVSNCRTFDMKPCYDASLDDIDELLVQEYISKAISSDVLASDTRDIKRKMSSLRLFDIKSDHPTNAAVILFGRSPKYFFPGSYIQYVHFSGIDNASDIDDERIFDRNIVSMLPEFTVFLDAAVIKKRPVRATTLKEVTEKNYPEWALRELIMNAIMHRDYYSNTPIKFYQYSNRIDIVNPGGLYGNATPNNFPNVNDYRNPIIAEVLKVYGYVNKFNRGIAKVQKELSINGNGLAVFSLDKETVFEVKVGSAIVNLSPLVNTNIELTNQDNINPIDNNKKVKTPYPSSFEKIKNKFTSKSIMILGFCKEQPLTKREIFNLIGLTNQTNNVRAHILPLVEEGLLTKTMIASSSKLQQYVTTSSGLDYLAYINEKN